MSKLPIISGEDTVKALNKSGFGVVRQRGSHVYLKHADGRTTVVPVHKGKDIDRGLLRKILRDAELSIEKFKELLK